MDNHIKLGELEKLDEIQIELASGETRPGEVCGPMRLKIGDFREMFVEILFIDMEPDPDGNYEPLIGCLPRACDSAGTKISVAKGFG